MFFIGFGVGLSIGWVFFKRPDFVQSLFDKIKAKVKSIFEGL